MSLKLFLFIDALLVFLICLLDWLLSKDQRSKIKDAVLGYWYFIEATSWSGLLRTDARKVYTFFTLLAGRNRSRLLSRQHHKLIYICCINLSLILCFQLFDIDLFLTKQTGFAAAQLVLLVAIFLFSILVVVTSLAITLRLIRMMVISVSTSYLVGLMLLDILAVTILFAFFSAAVDEWSGLFTRYEYSLLGDKIVDVLRGAFNDRPVAPINIDEEARRMYLAVAGKMEVIERILGTLVFLPTALVFLVAFMFMISKAIPNLLKPITTLILARLYEDERSVLSVIAIALGAIAALLKAGGKLI